MRICQLDADVRRFCAWLRTVSNQVGGARAWLTVQYQLGDSQQLAFIAYATPVCGTALLDTLGFEAFSVSLQAGAMVIAVGGFHSQSSENTARLIWANVGPLNPHRAAMLIFGGLGSNNGTAIDCTIAETFSSRRPHLRLNRRRLLHRSRPRG
jgi:hypothetical protein